MTVTLSKNHSNGLSEGGGCADRVEWMCVCVCALQSTELWGSDPRVSMNIIQALMSYMNHLQFFPWSRRPITFLSPSRLFFHKKLPLPTAQRNVILLHFTAHENTLKSTKTELGFDVFCAVQILLSGWTYAYKTKHIYNILITRQLSYGRYKNIIMYMEIFNLFHIFNSVSGLSWECWLPESLGSS